MNKHSLGLLVGSALTCLGAACGDMGTTADSGTTRDSGVTVDSGVPCTFSSCGADGFCNPTTHVCDTRSCTAGNEQPDVCAYGQYCGGLGSAAQCYDVAAPSCTNFGGSGHAVTWNQATSTGPIIYYVDKTTADTTWCTGSTPADLSVTVSLYYKNGTFAATGATFPSNTLYYVRSDGVQCDVTNCNGQGGMFRPASGYSVSADRKSVDIKMNFCGVTGSSLSVGFYYTGGNEYCAAFTK